MDDRDSSSESRSEDFQIDDEDKWEDLEADAEAIQVTSLLDDKVFPDVQSMLEYCRDKYSFDLLEIVKRFKLDFYSTIKLINYVRSEVKKGNTAPDISRSEIFENDRYLQPVLEDDAVLFSIGDLVDFADDGDVGAVHAGTTEGKSPQDSEATLARVNELEEQLRRLQSEFSAYRAQVAETLDKRWNDAESRNDLPDQPTKPSCEPKREEKASEHSYFDSYSYNDIHETMLRDTVRTDAYRDFIYDNKHLFAGKTVLDVGCGTGILSLLCAKAGAAKVIAVDNSSIIEKARLNVVNNGLSDTITCLRGKIEEVTLPVPSVDIIVSEWMGYCLLFEAMLDSVLWARDRYLKPHGLMVPSHCVLHIAPVADSEYIADAFSFWYDVYGFDMSAMMDKIYDDVLVRQLQLAETAGPSYPFYTLPLHTITKEQLDFEKRFEVTLARDAEVLDGWCIWFDTFFLSSRDAELPPNPDPADWKQRPCVAFTTGPQGKETHWKSGVMAIKRKGLGSLALKAGTKICGTVGYKKGSENERELDIEVAWAVEGSEISGKQSWFLR